MRRVRAACSLPRMVLCDLFSLLAGAVPSVVGWGSQDVVIHPAPVTFRPPAASASLGRSHQATHTATSDQRAHQHHTTQQGDAEILLLLLLLLVGMGQPESKPAVSSSSTPAASPAARAPAAASHPHQTQQPYAAHADGYASHTNGVRGDTAAPPRPAPYPVATAHPRLSFSQQPPTQQQQHQQPVAARPVAHQMPPAASYVRIAGSGVTAPLAPSAGTLPISAHARGGANHSESMIAYLSGLLAQAENMKDASHQYHDIHTLRTQLQAIQAVTKAQQAHQQEKAQLVQQTLHQQFDPNSMQILDGPTHVNSADNTGVKFHQAKKTRTTSEESSTSIEPSNGPSYETLANRLFDLPGMPSNVALVAAPEVPITTVSSSEDSVPSLPSHSAPFDLPLQTPAVPMQLDSDFIPGSPFEQGMFPSSTDSDYAGGLLYGQDMAEPETDFVPWSPVHVPEPISQEQLEAEQREYDLQMQRLAATKHERSTSSTSSSGSSKSSIVVTVTPPAASTSPQPMTVQSNHATPHHHHATPHQPQAHYSHHDRDHIMRNSSEVHTPHTTNSASTSSSEGSGSGAPARQAPSLSSQGPIIQGFSGMSKVFLANYLSADVLSILEREYGAGNFSAAAVRQHFMWMTASLEPEEQAELLVQFRDMQLHKSNALPCPRKEGCAAAQGALLHPKNAPPGSVCHAMVNAAQHTPMDHLQHHDHVATPSSHASSRLTPSLPPEVIKAQQAALMKAFGDDLSPQNAAADDLDGVARVRITILFSVPPATAAVVAKAAQKRKKLASTPASSFQSPDDAPAHASTAEQLTLVNYSDNDALVSKNNCKVISTTASPGSSQQWPDFHTHRCIQVNQAFERLTGYTQREMMALIQSEDSRPRLNQLMFKQVRSDHLAACHRITMKWRLSSVSEGHMYQGQRNTE
jgi:hypothetical protein